MKNPRKRLLVAFLVLVLLALILVLGFRYLPLAKIFRRSPVKESVFVNSAVTIQQAPFTLYFDFEVDPSSGSHHGLYKGIAHSGQYSSKAFGTNSYSYSVERKVSETGVPDMKAVAVSAWVYIFPGKQEVNASLVFTLTNEMGVNVCWKGLGVKGPEVPRGEWFKVSDLFDLSGITVKPDYKLQVYFWNNSSNDILVDDYFIVFGKPPERRGDSARVDMTLGKPFAPRFNFPPFPTFFLEKEEIGNSDSTYLAYDRKTGGLQVAPSDRIFTGNFVSAMAGTDQLLVIRQGGITEMFSFCSEKKEFVTISLSVSQDVAGYFDSPRILTGDFTGTGKRELLFVGKEKTLLAGFSKLPEPCKENNGKKISFEPVWKSGNDLFSGPGNNKTKILSLDADGDKQSEVLTIRDNGSWSLHRFSLQEGRFSTIASADPGSRVTEWTGSGRQFSVVAGKFSEHLDRDLLLTIDQDNDTKVSRYSLRYFNSRTGSFLPYYTGNDHFGKTIGLDTLKVSDRFFILASGPREIILRYNRDWRYDLKWISFSDSAFTIHGNVDFRGYKGDRNPKYYEVLKIISGNFTSRKNTSLLVIGRNCRQRDPVTGECTQYRNLTGLPGTIQLFTFPNPENRNLQP